ncbi:hypothetical protein GMA19_04209 [Paenibacillus polymyxa E681]|uniref:hypothetical protein n=1 Tax=Paenibacillus polymyxa TaxID=1406 RepID=UPI0005C57B07|nr:hypothetical protein [Paenibacillus polymyxa]ADM71979.2 hypothetical protein PPE_04199 [Paenibacillus polymyxa E681]QNV59013.1 hypothetical protein GE561_04220 [Paenibacillus polymyxa E681]QNV63839.1 hypothetical protein GMA19_04209 [Paenibacillus polymyxa E681]
MNWLIVISSFSYELSHQGNKPVDLVVVKEVYLSRLQDLEITFQRIIAQLIEWLWGEFLRAEREYNNTGPNKILGYINSLEARLILYTLLNILYSWIS